MHPANVFIIWLTNLVVYVVIGLWSIAVEARLNRYYFRKWGTNREQFEDADLADGYAYQIVNRRPPSGPSGWRRSCTSS